MSTPLDARSNDGLPMAARTDRWLRVAKIVALYTLVAPLIAGLMIFAEMIVVGSTNARYAVTLDNFARVWWSWIAMSYFVGAPYALVTSAVFAFAAVLAGRRQLAVSLAIAVVPILLFYLLLALGDPVWRSMFFVIYGIVLIAMPTTICWYLTRRWHSRTA